MSPSEVKGGRGHWEEGHLPGGAGKGWGKGVAGGSGYTQAVLARNQGMSLGSNREALFSPD